MAELAAAAALIGDWQRALRLCQEAIKLVDSELEPWYHITAVTLIPAMVRQNMLPIVVALAARITDQHMRVWSVAEVTTDLAQRRLAVAAALRVSDWSPIWAPMISPGGTKPPEFRSELRPWPDRVLAACAPEAVKAIAEEIHLLMERPS
ncbi:hypothetical protein [Actinoplanes awajinensis]|uniref:Tetratricopeptide repeat protein n=1 Tax=Actinoplanes awajinensis subsp. mycoplanecinus TaxID=135947 RepID=A0A124G8H2_9ACTN|nr:hypothetical protein [Actinoplanes awajinensis]KUL25867.1 hypothetical protein ADL15_39885 [Actinoplanes awajinensis subsp. mycoplanecinus]